MLSSWNVKVQKLIHSVQHIVLFCKVMNIIQLCLCQSLIIQSRCDLLRHLYRKYINIRSSLVLSLSSKADDDQIHQYRRWQNGAIRRIWGISRATELQDSRGTDADPESEQGRHQRSLASASSWPASAGLFGRPSKPTLLWEFFLNLVSTTLFTRINMELLMQHTLAAKKEKHSKQERKL